MRKEIVGNAILYLGDSIRHALDASQVDAVITDPPYGLNHKWDAGNIHGKRGSSKLWGEKPEWDKEPVPFDALWRLLQVGRKAICWGGNFYPMPPARCWLIWDKIQVFHGADFEMAWTNLDGPPRAFRMSRIDAYQNRADEPKQHPTEKPVDLMLWCLERAGDPGCVFDPFMGSGTTGVACMKRGKHFVGVEREERYFDIACTRIENAQRQERLFA